ncbi:hypothetical protein ABK040_006978 [Willaertia magna]
MWLIAAGALVLFVVVRYVLMKPKKDIPAKDKVIVITGAAGGFGYSFCKHFLEMGSKVIATDISINLLENNLKDLIKKYNKNNLQLLELDITKMEQITQCKEQINDILKNDWNIPNIYCLINNAGIANAPTTVKRDAVINCDENELKTMFEVNILGSIRVTRELFNLMKRNESVICNIASIAGLYNLQFMGFYNATKHAMVGFSETLRKEMKHVGIRVITVCPGFSKTNIVKIKPFNEESEFNNTFQTVYKRGKHFMENGMDPDHVCTTVIGHVFSTNGASRLFIDKFLYVIILKLVIIYNILWEFY